MASELRDTLRFLQTETVRLQEENRELREENTALRQVLSALFNLHDVSSAVTAETDVLALLDGILHSALAALNATAGSLILVDEDTGELVFTVVHGELRERLVNYRLPPGTGIAGWVAKHLEPVIIPNARADPRFSPAVDQHFGFQTRSLLCVPIVTRHRVMGVLTALNKADGREFDSDDLALLKVISQLAAAGMERAETAAEK